MVIQNSLNLLADLCEIEQKIKEVEKYLNEQRISVDEDLILKILRNKNIT